MRNLVSKLGAAALLSLTVVGSSAAAPPQERALQARELVELYRDKTWQWKDGAAYFATSHDFKATGKSHGAPTKASGQWLVSDQGVMCFNANWTDGKWRKWDRTCFEHRFKDNAILQRRMPNGTWYVFRSTPPRADDEAGKFTTGEHLTAATGAKP